MDAGTETLLTMKQARKRFPTQPSERTLRHWRLVGLRGVKLDSCRVGQWICTSEEAITRFLRATNKEST